MTQLNLLSTLTVYNRVLACRETFLTGIVREALSAARFEPEILVKFTADIDRAAKDSKKVRLMDELWREEKLPRFPCFADTFKPSDFNAVDAQTFNLHIGRPRAVTAELLLVLVVVDGVFSLTSAEGYERLVGSEVFQAVVGDGHTPARSTVGKYLELVSQDTHDFIHKTLCRMVSDEGLDTFDELTVDSTAIEANTSWPSESALIYGFLSRIHRLLKQQSAYTDVEYASKLVERWLKQIADLHRTINLLPARPGSVAERRKLYRRLLAIAEKAKSKLRELLNARRDEMKSCCIQPSLRIRVDNILKQIDTDFDEAGKAVTSARARVLHAQSVSASEKVFSLADPDAYMIVKGGREPVVGYKPQLGRSACGFISCFEVTRGNPADSERLLPMLEAHIKTAGKCPVAVSTDDGYSSSQNLEKLTDSGVETVSFSGSTGRKVLGDEFYDTDVCATLRSERSAVESLMFTFKDKMNMRRFSRRGLTGVRKDLSAAVLAYNLWRMAFVRKTRVPKGGVPVPLIAA